MITSRDRYSARVDMKMINRMIDTFIISYTTCPTCGFDEFTQSGKNPDCPTCNGTGKIEIKTKRIIYGRISWPNLTDVIIGIVGTIDSGDAILYTAMTNRTHFNNLKTSGYIIIGSERCGIKSISTAGLGEADELAVLCSRQTE